MRTGSRDSRILSILVPEMDNTADRNATVHADKQRKHIILSRRQSSNRQRKIGARHRHSASYNTIHNSNIET